MLNDSLPPVRAGIAADVPVAQLAQGLALVGLRLSNRPGFGLVIHAAPDYRAEGATRRADFRRAPQSVPELLRTLNARQREPLVDELARRLEAASDREDLDTREHTLHMAEVRRCAELARRLASAVDDLTPHAHESLFTHATTRARELRDALQSLAL